MRRVRTAHVCYASEVIKHSAPSEAGEAHAGPAGGQMTEKLCFCQNLNLQMRRPRSLAGRFRMHGAAGDRECPMTTVRRSLRRRPATRNWEFITLTALLLGCVPCQLTSFHLKHLAFGVSTSVLRRPCHVLMSTRMLECQDGENWRRTPGRGIWAETLEFKAH